MHTHPIFMASCLGKWWCGPHPPLLPLQSLQAPSPPQRKKKLCQFLTSCLAALLREFWRSHESWTGFTEIWENSFTWLTGRPNQDSKHVANQRLTPRNRIFNKKSQKSLFFLLLICWGPFFHPKNWGFSVRLEGYTTSRRALPGSPRHVDRYAIGFYKGRRKRLT